MQLHRVPLSKNWEFKQESSLNNGTATSYLPVSQFPTVAHIDLLHHGLIPDPYIDTNELECLWVNDADWTYRTSLPPISELMLGGQGQTRKAELVFEGLDTVVSVCLDGQLILEGNNMHISYRVDITSLLTSSSSEDHVLELKFQNAPAYARKEMQRIGYKGNGTDVHFGGPERLFVRKAQYHWGWDWGPAVNTCGPWKDVFLEVFEERIEDFIVRQEVPGDLETAVVKISGSVVGGGRGKGVDIVVEGPDGHVVLKDGIEVKENGTFKGEMTVEKPQLWWPFTYGSQPLYTIRASLAGHDEQVRKIGFRRLQLLQHSLKNAEGTSFTFEINNTRIFCGGSCWIPADFMLPRVTAQKYHDWLSLAKLGNQYVCPLSVSSVTLTSASQSHDPCLGRRHRRIPSFLFRLRRARHLGLAGLPLRLRELPRVARFRRQGEIRSGAAGEEGRSSSQPGYLGGKQRGLYVG